MSVSRRLIWFGHYRSTYHYICLRDTTPQFVPPHQAAPPSTIRTSFCVGYRHISCRESIGGVHFTVAPLAAKISMDSYPISQITNCFDLKTTGSKLQLERHSILVDRPIS